MSSRLLSEPRTHDELRRRDRCGGVAGTTRYARTEPAPVPVASDAGTPNAGDGSLRRPQAGTWFPRPRHAPARGRRPGAAQCPPRAGRRGRRGHGQPGALGGVVVGLEVERLVGVGRAGAVAPAGRRGAAVVLCHIPQAVGRGAEHIAAARMVRRLPRRHGTTAGPSFLFFFFEPTADVLRARVMDAPARGRLARQVIWCQSSGG